MIVTLTPNPSLDKTYHLDSFAREAVNRVQSVTVEAAGKGVNVARGLHAAGIEATAVVPVGGPDGARYEKLLAQSGLPHRSVGVAGNLRTNVSVVEADGTTTKLNEPGPELSPDEIEAILRVTIEATEHGTWVAACGSLPRGVPASFYGDLVKQVHSAGGRIAIDASGPALAGAVEAGPDLVKPNADELRELTGSNLDTMGDIVAAAKTLVSGGVGAVLVSLGADGAVIVDHRGAVHGKVTVDQVRNTVGAGDTLLAGFLAGGDDPTNALVSALTWARAAVRSPDTAMAQVSEEDRQAVQISEQVPEQRPVGSA